MILTDDGRVKRAIYVGLWLSQSIPTLEHWWARDSGCKIGSTCTFDREPAEHRQEVSIGSNWSLHGIVLSEHLTQRTKGGEERYLFFASSNWPLDPDANTADKAETGEEGKYYETLNKIQLRICLHFWMMQAISYPCFVCSPPSLDHIIALDGPFFFFPFQIVYSSHLFLPRLSFSRSLGHTLGLWCSSLRTLSTYF